MPVGFFVPRLSFDSPFLFRYFLICGCYLLHLDSAFLSSSLSLAGPGLPTRCFVQGECRWTQSGGLSLHPAMLSSPEWWQWHRFSPSLAWGQGMWAMAMSSCLAWFADKFEPFFCSPGRRQIDGHLAYRTMQGQQTGGTLKSSRCVCCFEIAVS